MCILDGIIGLDDSEVVVEIEATVHTFHEQTEGEVNPDGHPNIIKEIIRFVNFKNEFLSHIIINTLRQNAETSDTPTPHTPPELTLAEK